ncbi:MAG: phospholipid/cholesterol/gamma-HCH transport system substrate-binding protein [Lysobacterales bacterium]|jgi:phospholipid/cholesterol/gamma-HCH transport system substrate-binding protein
MKKEEFIKKLSAGLFLLIGIFLIFIVVATLGKDKGLAQKKIQIEVLYRNVGGLIVGAPIRLDGVSVGNVADINFLQNEIEGRSVKVILNILAKFENQFKRNLAFSIQTEGVLGSKLIEINAINSGDPVDLTQPIMGEESLNVQDLAKEFSKAAASFTKTSQEMSKIDMLEMSEVMIESSKALLNTSKGINKILEELEEMSVKSKRLFDRIEQMVIDGKLFKVF